MKTGEAIRDSALSLGERLLKNSEPNMSKVDSLLGELKRRALEARGVQI